MWFAILLNDTLVNFFSWLSKCCCSKISFVNCYGDREKTPFLCNFFFPKATKTKKPNPTLYVSCSQPSIVFLSPCRFFSSVLRRTWRFQAEFNATNRVVCEEEHERAGTTANVNVQNHTTKKKQVGISQQSGRKPSCTEHSGTGWPRRSLPFLTSTLWEAH